MSHVETSQRGRWLVATVLALVLVWTLYPLWWAVVLSFKRPEDFFTARWLPFVQFSPTLANWRDEWQNFAEPAGLGRGLLNSLLIGLASSLLSLLLGGLAALGLTVQARRGQRIWPWLACYLVPLALPAVNLVWAFSQQMKWLGLDDTPIALSIAHTTLGLPLAVIILYGALRELPNDRLQAAELDGYTGLPLLWYVVLPAIAPALLGAGLLCFAKSWNEFLYAVTNVQVVAQSAPLAIAALLNKDGVEFEYVGSHLLLVLLPPLLLSLFAQRVVARAFSLGMVEDE